MLYMRKQMYLMRPNYALNMIYYNFYNDLTATSVFDFFCLETVFADLFTYNHGTKTFLATPLSFQGATLSAIIIF